MTMQVVTHLSSLKGTFAGKRCWIVGCGPSIDKYDSKLLGHDHIFAVNAAITLFLKSSAHRNANWFFRDRRIIHEVHSKLDSWARWKVVTHHSAYNSLRDVVKMSKRNSSAVIYGKDWVIHKRTVIEDVLQVAQFMGFDSAYMFGVDHFLIDNQPYATPFRWKECHFYNPKKPSATGKSIALQSMVAAMKNIKDRIRMKVYNTSPYYPEEVFEYVDFNAAVSK